MIKLRNLITEQAGNIPPVVYHATFLKLLDSIKKHGIGPGGMSHAGFKSWNIANGVYLADDPDYAGSLVYDAPDIPPEWIDDIYIISIKSMDLDHNKIAMDPQMNLSDDELEDPDFPKSWIYESSISPSSFLEINPGTYQW